MAVRQVLVSDLSGEDIIPEGAAKVTIHLTSQPSRTFTLDVNEHEIAELVDKATSSRKRGRPPKVAATNGA